MKTVTSLLIILFCTSAIYADEILVAAASDLQFALPKIATAFEKKTQHRVKFSFASSGNLFAQINNGAPFDLFFSADTDYPRKLAPLAGPLHLYARGQIVLWTRKDSGIDVSKGFDALLQAKKVAIANPEHAPYGKAALAALQHAKIYEKVRSKLVLGENISQTAGFIESGAAQIGIISLALASESRVASLGRYWNVPLDAYPVMNQAAVLLKASPHSKIAETFLSFVTGPTAQKVLKQSGFLPPSW